MRYQPNLRSILNKIEPSGDRYIDHLNSFIDDSGQIYWVSCPYVSDDGMLAIARIFERAGIPCEVSDGFYAGCTIIIPAIKTRELAYKYSVIKCGNMFKCVKMTLDGDNVQTIAIFDDDKSAHAFIAGINYASEKLFNY
jgi:hypothetical protein